MTAHFDVLVLGAGPGGYVAAIRASQLGKTVAVVEQQYWGGVCLNVGCIPTKALIQNAEIAMLLATRKDTFAIDGDARVDYGRSHARSRAVSDGIVGGVHYLLKKNGVTEIHGHGVLTGTHAIDVTDADSSGSYTFDDLILAVGAEVRVPPGIKFSQNVVSYREQILDDKLPGSIVIGGAGAIGVEFAFVMRSFGADVTIVEFLDRMVPSEDAEVSKELQRHYKKLGIKVLVATRVDDVIDTGTGVRVTVSPIAGGDAQVLEADRFLAAFGFAPRTKGFGLDALGVDMTDRGAIAVDEAGRTSASNVYAVGDCTGKLMLAHTAEAMGVVAAEAIAGLDLHPIDFDSIPRATYGHPQIASFGLTQAQAEERGLTVRVGKFPFSANGKAQALGDAVGFVKIVVDAYDDTLVGAHMIGPDVTELLPALTLAYNAGLTAHEVVRNVIAHPTLGEATKEAVGATVGHLINL